LVSNIILNLLDAGQLKSGVYLETFSGLRKFIL